MSMRYLTALLWTTLLWSRPFSAALAQPPSATITLKSQATEHDAEVGIDFRIIRVSELCLSHIGIDFPSPGQTQDDTQGNAGVIFLNDLQARHFVEAAQKNPKTGVMQAPKLSLLSGQQSALAVAQNQCFLTGMNVCWKEGKMVCLPEYGSYPIGLQVKLLPIVSDDRRSVRLKLEAKETQLESADVPLAVMTSTVTPIVEERGKGEPVSFTQNIQQPKISTVGVEKTLSVPAGATALLFGGKRTSASSDEQALPVLGNIPYINQLFGHRKKKPETECVLFMVKPRIMNRVEVEARANH